jgi:hypothetical protein
MSGAENPVRVFGKRMRLPIVPGKAEKGNAGY